MEHSCLICHEPLDDRPEYTNYFYHICSDECLRRYWLRKPFAVKHDTDTGHWLIYIKFPQPMKHGEHRIRFKGRWVDTHWHIEKPATRASGRSQKTCSARGKGL